MTPLTPREVREASQLIRDNSSPLVHELIAMLERRVLLDESMLAMRSRVDSVCNRILDGTLGDTAEVLPFPSPGYSVKVPGDAA